MWLKVNKRNEKREKEEDEKSGNTDKEWGWESSKGGYNECW